VAQLIYRLVGFAEENDLGKVFPGPFDVLFAEGDYVEPDVVFVRTGRLDLVSSRGVEGPPDLVVEVLSPSTVDRDRGIKLERYRLFGVAEYWVVDPDEQSVEVWALASGAGAPVALGPRETLRWTPVEGGPTLELEVSVLFDPSVA
jgi:Uma2 family endonuclease